MSQNFSCSVVRVEDIHLRSDDEHHRGQLESTIVRILRDYVNVRVRAEWGCLDSVCVTETSLVADHDRLPIDGRRVPVCNAPHNLDDSSFHRPTRNEPTQNSSSERSILPKLHDRRRCTKEQIYYPDEDPAFSVTTLISPDWVPTMRRTAFGESTEICGVIDLVTGDDDYSAVSGTLDIHGRHYFETAQRSIDDPESSKVRGSLAFLTNLFEHLPISLPTHTFFLVRLQC